MKKFSKLLAVVLAIAVVICPMTSAIVANATSGGSYSIVAENANDVVLTINSNDGFIVYQATVTFNNGSAFQNSYSTDGYTNGLKVIDYTLVSGSKDAYNAPAISAQQNGASLVLLVSATDAACLDLYSKVQIGIRVADGSTANLTKIQAADEGTVEEDPSLLNFGAKVGDDGTVDSTNNAAATTGESHTHNYTKDTPYEVTAPTCTAYGVYRKTCTVCGAVDDSATYTGTVMAAHTPSNVQNATNDFLASAATCTAPASYNYECTVCHAAITSEMAGYTGTFTSGTALGHNMTTHTASAADCTTAGNSLYYSCDRCNKYFSDAEGNTEIAANSWVIAATGHTPVTDAAVAATCVATGKTAGSHCSVCGAVIEAQEDTAIDPTNHTNIVNDAAVAPTCVATGKTAGSHCADCGATIVAQDTVAATGVHTYGEYVSNGNATCGVDGTKTRTCSVCGATDTVTDTGSATGLHTPVTDAAVAATCTATGLTEGSHCSVCGTVITAQTTTPIDPTNHTAVVEDAAVAATCTATGLTAGSHCTACDTTIVAQSTVPALGHNYTYDDNGDGTHDVACTRCDYSALAQTCVDENEDNICDFCEADLTPAGSVLDASINILTPQIQISSSMDIIIRATKATTSGAAGSPYASSAVVFTPQRFNNLLMKYYADPIVIDLEDYTTKNNAAIYYNIASYELDLPISYYVACYDALGTEVAHSETLSVTPSELLKSKYKATPSTAVDIAMNRLVTDTLNLGYAAQAYFAPQVNGGVNDLGQSAPINDEWPQTYASESVGDLTDVTNFDWNPSSSVTESTNPLRLTADISGAPVIKFSILRATATGSSPLDYSKLRLEASYTTLYTQSGSPEVRSDVVTGSDWNKYVDGKNLRYNFTKAAMYDANKTVTFVLTYDGTEVCTCTYSMDSYIYSSDNSVASALGKFNASARAYFVAQGNTV